MSTLPEGQKRRSPAGVILQWWRDWKTRSDLSDLTCYAEAELERIAKDIGISSFELRKLARRGPDAAKLLHRRMAALDLDRNEVSKREPDLYNELERLCTLCASRRQCSRDLAAHSTDQGWEDYCPNVATLKMLNAMPWAARRV